MSEIITDNLTGKTSAGNVTITSEGGSATMQLQQGLAKAWMRLNGDSSAIDGVSANSIGGSFNVSSYTDQNIGRYESNITNSFSSTADIVVQTNSSYSQGNTTFYPDNFSTSVLGIRTRNDAGTYTDTNRLFQTVHGSLA